MGQLFVHFRFELLVLFSCVLLPVAVLSLIVAVLTFTLSIRLDDMTSFYTKLESKVILIRLRASLT